MLKKISSKISKYFPQIFALLFLTAFAVFAWQEPSQTPPGGNVPAPINVGSAGQSKSGGLILNTGGAATGLIVDKGNVGIGTASPGEKLEVSGNIKVGGEFLTASNEGSCPIWKDCDNDTKTAGSGDCDESCVGCYVGSSKATVAPDGKDQNCNGVVDDFLPAGEYTWSTTVSGSCGPTGYGSQCDFWCQDRGGTRIDATASVYDCGGGAYCDTFDYDLGRCTGSCNPGDGVCKVPPGATITCKCQFPNQYK